ncbi:hypothetical protein DSM104299_00483 [Baekduia alba]|uniref:TetR/AcrR family transcriptional regulator n=1 Tax=Baekduia alba TaxID=2997333 RepID=UPI00234057B7|nr:TetR/AcrR family transcriptional regulator [Baekduia alba]WCB91806.1 hypothetical protein DSM104299_00483 [Baekduia alba]
MTAEPESKEPSRLERRREERKQAILRAAGAELARAGFSRASLDDIAERVHVTKATLYHYYENKEALYHAWMEAISAQVHAELVAEAEAAGETARGRLWRLAHREVMILTTGFPDYARLFMGAVDWPESFQEQIRELRRGHEALFRGVISDGVASGEFRVVDETVARYCLQGALIYVPEWFRDDGRSSAGQIADAVADTVIRMFEKA